ncbi:hypothetical protein DSO57_1014448 [Entomophthora muscae]|uniref:Uncharacterized protein n=1 Tax=Entomophthora muscae TaxID=34485 RepID=A0ACC2RK77_9FUNG|nr:hypothetical protein DSO57_1014448 [Entomophthora muscae]
MPNTTISHPLKWYLVQVMPTSKNLFPTQMAMLACKYLFPINLKRVPTHSQLVKFVSDRRQTSNPLAKSATIIKYLVLTDAPKRTEDGEMFLLHDNVQEMEDRIIAYATTQNLEPLNPATTWLCDGTFTTCPSVRIINYYNPIIHSCKESCAISEPELLSFGTSDSGLNSFL